MVIKASQVDMFHVRPSIFQSSDPSHFRKIDHSNSAGVVNVGNIVQVFCELEYQVHHGSHEECDTASTSLVHC